jgi:hypothetical protein
MTRRRFVIDDGKPRPESFDPWTEAMREVHYYRGVSSWIDMKNGGFGASVTYNEERLEKHGETREEAQNEVLAAWRARWSKEAR